MPTVGGTPWSCDAVRQNAARTDPVVWDWDIVNLIEIWRSEKVINGRPMPLGNEAIDGLGNHTPSSGRYAGMVGGCAVLHPGRLFATNLKVRNETADDIPLEAKENLRVRLLPRLGSL